MNQKIIYRTVMGIMALLLTACAASSPSPETVVHPGMRPGAVTALLGEPARRELFAPDRYVYFYASGPYQDRPLCFDKHRLVHVGPELLTSWRQERLTLATGNGSTGGSTDALSAKARARVKATLKAERDARIAELERQVRPLPLSATSKNLKLYRELLSLDPNNVRYQRKVAFYKARFKVEQAQIDRVAKKRQETARKRRNKELRVYEGNDQIQIAIVVEVPAGDRSHVVPHGGVGGAGGDARGLGRSPKLSLHHPPGRGDSFPRRARWTGCVI